MTYDTELISCKRDGEARACMRRMPVSHGAVQVFLVRLQAWLYHDFSSLDIPSGSFFFKPFSFRSSNGQSGQNQTIESERDFRDYQSTTYVKSKDTTYTVLKNQKKSLI